MITITAIITFILGLIGTPIVLGELLGTFALADLFLGWMF